MQLGLLLRVCSGAGTTAGAIEVAFSILLGAAAVAMLWVDAESKGCRISTLDGRPEAALKFAKGGFSSVSLAV